ncbi:hypothetical protein GALMADRAFT_724171 [Galerina marginata CBS 339.88]|uniref:DUF6533 domain-containing protein n=1 Tax=Galerina marginata (strain CBS 339.88) TaxID=685588 RepID=A0A067SZS9_GALM3|nr:hypothetical protein GALMADRAFT_724171 [Galerina marginata CBS 339.88]
MSNISELPNPFTPMAFIPPELAFQITIATYVLVGSVSVLIWDILLNLQTDLKMLLKRPLRMPTIIYFISSSLAYLLGITTLQTSPVGHCQNVHYIQFLYPIVVPSTSLLFFFRIRAMYLGNNVVIVFFFFMWLAVIGGSLTPTQGLFGTNIGTTKYCLNSHLEPYVAAACIIPFVNDTLVFCATSWRLMQNSYVDTTIKNGVSVMVFGRHLPSFPRSLLQDGQAYYLTTITLNLVTSCMFFNLSIPVVYRSFIGVPNIVLMNSMACHVYRNVRLGAYREFLPSQPSILAREKSTTPSTLAFTGNPSRPSVDSIRLTRINVDAERDIISNPPIDYDAKDASRVETSIV